MDWENLYYGHSFFVPSMNWKHDKAAIQKAADAVGCGVKLKGVVEANVRGIRVWVDKPVI